MGEGSPEIGLVYGRLALLQQMNKLAVILSGMHTDMYN